MGLDSFENDERNPKFIEGLNRGARYENVIFCLRFIV